MEFQFGDWLVCPEANLVSNGDAKTQLEPRVMAVLRYLCRHPGAVIPAEEILQACWGSNELGDNPVHKAITQLRRAFGDSSTEPRYIETIRKRGYRAIAPVITLAAPPATTWEGGSPFRGLEAFQENHAAIFFGRVQATAQLRDLVLTQAAHGSPMALVLGPSGSGKTSLVRAGLLPQLMAGAIRSDEPVGLTSTVYLDCADLGSGTLFQALAGVLIDADINDEPLFPGASADSLGQRLASEPDAIAAELRERGCQRVQVGVFIDRLEAVFRAQPEEADRFMGVIEVLAKSNCLLILIACRNDFYPVVMAQPVLLALKTRGGHFDVLPPDGTDIAQIVRQPALAADLKFEKDESTGANLDDVLCDATRGNPDMLPLLQYTLNELYRQRDVDGTLQFEVYRQLGGIEGAVGVRAEQVVSTLTPSQIGALPHVLSLLINVGEDQSAVTSRRSPLSMLRTEDAKELVRVMVEARLFVSELAGDVPSFGVAHEALLRQWPRVVSWIDRYRSALQLRTRLVGQVRRWVEAGRARDLLLPRGAQVSQAAELLTLKDFNLAPAEQEFVRASVNRARFGERVRLAIMALIATLAVLTGIFGATARSAQKQAEQSRTEAEDLMTYMLGEFVEKLRPLGRLELLDDVSKKAMDYLGKDEVDKSSKASPVNRAKALRLIGEVRLNRGHPEEAAKAFSLAQGALEQLPSAPPAALREQAIIAFMNGQLHLHRNDLDKASGYFNDYLRLSDRFAKAAPDDTTALLEQSYAYTSVGGINLKKNNYKEAAGQFEQSLVLKQKVKTIKKYDASLEVDIANSYSWLAEAKLKLGDLAAARELYGQEERSLRPIHAGNGAWTHRLALSLNRQALLQVALGDQTAALKYLGDAEQLLLQLVKTDPSNQAWQTRLYSVQSRQIELKIDSANGNGLLAQLDKLSKGIADLTAQDPKNVFLRYQDARIHQLRGVLMARAGRREEGKQNLDAAVAVLEPLLQGKKRDTVEMTLLADALLARADFAQQAKDTQGARHYCERTRTLLGSNVADSTDYALLALQVRANVCADNVAAVATTIKTLEKMGFRDMRYLQYLSTQLKR
jgi:DNA-binding winged helix-turn-helix (wHTH) protein/tetratricopeptide (TPR) repeat protein